MSTGTTSTPEAPVDVDQQKDVERHERFGQDEHGVRLDERGVRLSVSNHCRCRYCLACEMHFVGDACLFGHEGIPEAECAGCRDDAAEHVAIVVNRWVEENPGQGWDGTDIAQALAALLPSAYPDDEITQVWRIEPWADGSPTVTSHRRSTVAATRTVTLSV